MSVRKAKKKRMVNLISDEEQIAKETLFQISYFEELNNQDQSQVLVPHKYDQSCSNSKEKNKDAGRRGAEKKKSKSLSSRNHETLISQDYSNCLQTIRENRKIAFNSIEDNDTIFNAIESNKVFVGNKIYFKSARPEPQQNKTILVNKKRVETMPAIRQRSDHQLAKKDYSSINRFNIKLEHPLINKIKIENNKSKVGLKNERESYLKLKNKLRRDRLIGLQERFSRKYQFFL